MYARFTALPSSVKQAVSLKRVSNVDWWILQDYPTVRLRMPHVSNYYTNLVDHIPHWSVTVSLRSDQSRN
jgi:hypothetical protein